jgi:hypothetical protein
VSSGSAPASRFRPAAAGAAETGQSEHDLTEQGGDLVRAVILDLAGGSAGATLRPPDRMVPALGCDDFLLDQSHKLLALRQGQTQIRDIAKVTKAVDRHHVNASARPIGPGFHQTHPIPDPQPAKNSAGHTLPTTAPPNSRQPRMDFATLLRTLPVL